VSLNACGAALSGAVSGPDGEAWVPFTLSLGEGHVIEVPSPDAGTNGHHSNGHGPG